MMDNMSLHEVRAYNRARAKKLKGEYKKEFIKLYKNLTKDVKQGTELEEAVSGIIDMLESAMNEKRPLTDVFGPNFEDFYNGLIDVLPKYTREEKDTRNRRKNISIIALVVLLVAGLILTVIWQTGLMGMWSRGIAYMAGSLDRYSYDCILLEDEYSVEIDLSDLESNKGKVLYDDGVHKIIVEGVDNTGTVLSGGYRIHFRSIGDYSLSGATLISGIRHYTTESRWFSYNMTSRLVSEYKGRRYEGTVMGESGLNFKDGDMFSFYLFPDESYKDGSITLNETGKVKVTVTELCKNIWSKK